MYVLALSAGGWLLLLQMLFLRFVKNSWFSSHSVALFYALSVYTAITFLFYRVFIVKERDQTIYNRFATAWNENPNKKRDLMLASLVAAAPYLVMLSMKIFLPR